MHRTLRPVGTATLLSLLVAALPCGASTPAVPVGPERVVTDDARGADLAVFDDGTYLVVWGQAGPLGDRMLRARRYTTDDRPAGEAFSVGPVAVLAGPEVPVSWDLVALHDDTWALAWSQPACEGCSNAIFLSLYDGEEPIVEGEPVDAGTRHRRGPVLAAGAEGRFAIAWMRHDPPPAPAAASPLHNVVMARLYDADGTPHGAAFRVDEGSRQQQLLADAAFLGSGDLVLLWNRYSGGTGVLRRHFDANGIPLGGELPVQENPEGAPEAPALTTTSTGYLVAWTDHGYSPPVPFPALPDGAIVGRYYFDDGAAASPELRISPATPPADRTGVALATAADGSILALWTAVCSLPPGECADGSAEDEPVSVYARALPPDHDPHDDPHELRVPLDTRGYQQGAVARAVSPGRFLALWGSSPVPGAPSRAVVRRVETPRCDGLCLHDDRFEVNVDWTDAEGNLHSATPVRRDDGWGTFWFFRQSNVEVAVKVLDGRSLTDHFWVFYASLSDVRYRLRVVDKVTGLRRTYDNAAGRFASRGDTRALAASPTTAAAGTPSPSRLPGSAGSTGSVPAPRAEAGPLSLAAGSGAGTAPAAAAATALPPCAPADVCLHGDRFRVEVEWSDFSDGSGDGTGTSLTSDTAWFWFFRRGNPEMLVKVLDGRPVNGHFWVFYAALSNVGFELRVTDRVSGDTATYESPLGSFASRGDTAAFRER